LAVFHGTSVAVAAFVHTMLSEYLSFMLLLFALYTVAGGILLTGVRASPGNNLGMLVLFPSHRCTPHFTGAIFNYRV
jgi:hypothetical protein